MIQTLVLIFKETMNNLNFQKNLLLIHCVKSVRIRNYSSPHFPAFGLNTERYGVNAGKCELE